MSQTFQHHGQLAAACAEWAKISLTGLQPRRNLNLSDKKNRLEGSTERAQALCQQR
ncbi:hypothetical protein [Comamonas sp. wu1-DMT]|uniref:hypothetical protein n=1 Tax=Comamonas sp. wu1-DMT TaxID=3126390 RepID=UPI0032E4EC73